jgi:general stress protein 26
MSISNQDEAVVDPKRIEPNREEAIAQISDFIVQNETWMLSTSSDEGVIRSRPMLNVNKTFDGELYLLVNNGDQLLQEVKENRQASIAISEPGKSHYVSITGTAEQIDDAKKAELLWNDDCKKWFGAESPVEVITVVRFDVASAEYWDASKNLINQFTEFFSASKTESLSDVTHKVIDWSNGH